MDQLKNLASKVGGGSSSSTGTSGNAAAAGGQKEDYGDKGLDFIEKKTGHSLSRDQNEKISDGARNFFEKQSGKDIPDKYSN